MDTGQFQGKVIAELQALGRDMAETRADTKAHAAAIADLRLQLAPLLNGTKRKLAMGAVWAASAGGIGYLLHALFPKVGQ